MLYKLSYEATQLGEGQVFGLIHSKMTGSQLSDFLAQLVLDHCNSIAEVMGSNPIEAAEAA